MYLFFNTKSALGAYETIVTKDSSTKEAINAIGSYTEKDHRGGAHFCDRNDGVGI